MIWAIYRPENLSTCVKDLLTEPSNEFLVSYAAVWELLNKVGRGGLKLADGTSVAEVFADVKSLGVTLLPVRLNDVLAAATLPDIHRDPFDRMLIAQALAEGVPLVTFDSKIQEYAVQTVWE